MFVRKTLLALETFLYWLTLSVHLLASGGAQYDDRKKNNYSSRSENTRCKDLTRDSTKTTDLQYKVVSKLHLLSS